MKPSSFQTTIENQFDYICKRAINANIRMYRNDHLKMYKITL